MFIILAQLLEQLKLHGVHGIIIPKRRAASVNATVLKTSVGAALHMKIARVNNVNETIRELKDKGLWICGTDMDTKTDFIEQDYNMPLAVVIRKRGKRNGETHKRKLRFYC